MVWYLIYIFKEYGSESESVEYFFDQPAGSWVGILD
jgi:hypothetical protein